MDTSQTLFIDIVSDVVCPWCIVGYQKVQQALEGLDDSLKVELRWHPFELNRTMPDEGQDLREHLAQKYGTTLSQSRAARDRLTTIGSDLGFEFKFHDKSRIYNTFLAHQLIHFAATQGLQTETKLALFDAYFTDQETISDIDVLCAVALKVGLDEVEVRDVLLSGLHAGDVRQAQEVWRQRGVQAVPAVIFNEKFLVSGAQDSATFRRVIDKVLSA